MKTILKEIKLYKYDELSKDEEEIKEYYEAEGQLFLESGEMYEE